MEDWTEACRLCARCAEVGKGWSKGLTAATDARVARAAAAHRGRKYRTRERRRRREIEWTTDFGYVVGLVATDGCLIRDGRHIAFGSCDRQLVETYLACLGKTNAIQEIRKKRRPYYRVQFSDIALHEFLSGIGLTPRKSLTLGALDVPAALFFPVARGLLDGDGTISNFVHQPTKARYPNYRYERLVVSFRSASRAHIEWLQSQLRERGLAGAITVEEPKERSRMFALRFGKWKSIRLLSTLYPSAEVPKLERKWQIWEDYRVRNAAMIATA